MSSTAQISSASPDRVAELRESLAEVKARVQKASASSQAATLVAVSKLKPASDIAACYELGQRDFGENYVQELEEKAAELQMPDIRWHFIGTLQSNKAKILASIPNIYAIQTVTSAKTATALNKHVPLNRASPLNVLLQVNTSGEDNKSGVPPLSPGHPNAEAELTQLALRIIKDCPRLHLQGLMTIGALTESLASGEHENHDFVALKQTRDLLQEILQTEFPAESGRWGVDGRLLLSMGMSSDFEAALKAGSDIVRVGTSIFGTRPKKVAAVTSS
ncbi:hypothetical protein NM688_g2581 [Phlebia brevispora]|uniref:Uncharacterized protein n=1 Tax=Phlebia brevispora TaxID=194682 RepID=A0ACC1T8B4_9APHY|nr:hypothetical protein NM688_g2581 [Phlebia brevispora]